jgi:hypothetical protein
MTDKKSVLVIGLDPTLIDFSQPGYAPGMDAQKVLAGLKSTWIEPDTGNTVTHVDDFENLIAHTNITDLASKGFWRLSGQIKPLP